MCGVFYVEWSGWGDGSLFRGGCFFFLWVWVGFFFWLGCIWFFVFLECERFVWGCVFFFWFFFCLVFTHVPSFCVPQGVQTDYSQACPPPFRWVSIPRAHVSADAHALLTFFPFPLFRRKWGIPFSSPALLRLLFLQASFISVFLLPVWRCNSSPYFTVLLHFSFFLDFPDLF